MNTVTGMDWPGAPRGCLRRWATWLVRSVSGLVLGREALGLGDVTLMAMIGSFVGWQPVLFIFLLAPFCGLVVGLLARVLTNRPFVPYGPFLAAAASVVLLAWRWIWLFPPNSPRGGFAVRNLFGEPQPGDPGRDGPGGLLPAAGHCPVVRSDPGPGS
ncbi:MAG: hypothetical protein CM1200mP2_24130 [Planctomycetaceae bacterium]|nr:MAG: hypothetical protein CM1200mP2_24130 [Planctomycetaceae bacterium]